MRILKLSLMMLSLGAFILGNPFTARADEWNKATTLTFNQPVEIPHMVLGSGTYMFKLADTVDRNVVQIYSGDGSRLYENVLAIPAYRQQATDNTVVTFEERATGSPEAINTWFYPGDNYGEQFVYPNAVATVASVAPVKTPLTTKAVEPTQQVNKPVSAQPTVAAAPKTEPVQISQATPPAQPAATTAKTAAPQKPAAKKLPKTASPLPTLVLIGLLSLGASAGIRAFSKQSI
jgi:hypothetical protein